MTTMYRCHRLVLFASMCVACGSVADKAGHLPDAGTPTEDTGPTGPVRGTVRVAVLEPGGTGNPAVGATVVFVDADGTVSKKTTDTAGKADADLLPGASVTSIVLVETRYTLQTVLALKPGDDIVLGMKTADAASAGTFAITVPLYDNASSYSVSTPCGYTTATPSTKLVATALFTNDCKKSPFEMVIVALDGVGNSLGSINVPSVNFIPNGSYTVTGSYGGLQSVTASYTGINPNVTAMQTMRVAPDAAGVTQSSPQMAPSGATASTTINGGVASKAQIITTVKKGTTSTQVIRQPVAGSASTYGLELASTLLPWIGKPSYDATTKKLLVPVDKTGTTSDKPDLFNVEISYLRTDSNQVSTAFNWSFYGPDIGDITLPSLPTDLGPLVPTVDDTVLITANAFDAASLNGYDSVRTNTKAASASYNSARPPDANIRTTRCAMGRASC